MERLTSRQKFLAAGLAAALTLGAAMGIRECRRSTPVSPAGRVVPIPQRQKTPSPRRQEPSSIGPVKKAVPALARPNFEVVKVHALAGTPSEVEVGPGQLAVYVVHKKSGGVESGCGALGHLNPSKARHAVDELWDGLVFNNVNPEKFFGLKKDALLKKILSINFPDKASKRAAGILERAAKTGKPTVVGLYGHADGTFKLVGTANLSQKQKYREIVAAICSDARLPERVAKLLARNVLERNAWPGYSDAEPETIAPNATVQAPHTIMVHLPEEFPVKDALGVKGKIFTVSSEPDKRLGLAGLVSIAYAITNFGHGHGHAPQGEKASQPTKSLQRIVATEKTLYDQLKPHVGQLTGGVKLELKD